MSLPLIDIKEAKKVYPMGGETVHALKGVDFTVTQGDFVAVMGPSGSGKSTLMHILGLLDSLTEGRYLLEGKNVSVLSRNARADIRNRKIGFIFQSFNLLGRSTALENVELPMLYHRPHANHRKEKALQALEMVGLADRAGHQPRQLSGGQQQRVAVARALVNSPSLILADEPTGNLDTRTGGELLELLTSLNRDGITIILVTHDQEVGAAARHRVYFRDGLVEKVETA